MALTSLSAAGAGRLLPARAQGPTPIDEPTPIIDPQPMPEPIYLPLAQQQFDALAPGAITTNLSGYVAALTRTGRDACYPATHAILSKPEGASNNEVRAVLRSAREGINLDFYTGEHVAVLGVQDLAPVDCQILTLWRMDVEDITIVDIPPGPTD